MRKLVIFLIAALFVAGDMLAASPEAAQRHVRNAVSNGNDAYRAKDYSKAETYYREALQYDKNASTALFNLALTLLRKNGNPVAQNRKNDSADGSEKKNANISDPVQLFNDVITLNRDANLVVNSFYNLGNIYFEANDLPQSIAYYKEALRRDQNHIKARQNLRVAQLKLQQQQDQKNNQDQQNQDQKDNKDQNKDKENQDKNQDQNNNQNNDKQKDQDKDKNDSSDKNNPENKPKENNGNQGNSGSQKPAMTKENSDKILESAKKQEEQTRKKVEMRRGSQTTRRTTDRPW